jgi:hypothetical protein
MSKKERIERPNQIIVTKIKQLPQSVKLKSAAAIQEVVNAIKTKHL